MFSSGAIGRLEEISVSADPRVASSRAEQLAQGCLANLSFVVQQVRQGGGVPGGGQQGSLGAEADQAFGQAEEQVEGLTNFLEGCKLQQLQSQAEEWCGEQGFDSLADVAEVEMEAEFVAALGDLKPGKRQLVLKRLVGLRSSAPMSSQQLL
jgi:hypothetical protein